MGSLFEIPQTGKEEFIKNIDRVIRNMKEDSHPTYCYEHTVICESKTSDVDLEFWNITFHNMEGRKFKAYIEFKVKWKSGKIQEIKYPYETWGNKKEFLDFLERECDK